VKEDSSVTIFWQLGPLTFKLGSIHFWSGCCFFVKYQANIQQNFIPCKNTQANPCTLKKKNKKTAGWLKPAGH